MKRFASFVIQALSALLIGSVTQQALAGPYIDAVLADNPVGYWRLEEGGTGIAVDSSPVSGAQSGIYGVRSGAAANGAITGPIINETNNTATVFNGFGRVDVEDNVGNIFGGAQEYTFEAWVLPGLDLTEADDNHVVGRGDVVVGAASTDWLMHNGDGGNDSYIVGVNGLAQKGAGDFAPLPPSNIPPLNEWVHMVATHTPNGADADLQIYINGDPQLSGATVPLAQDKFGEPITIGAARLGAGDDDDWFNHFVGAIDEVAFYGYALSEARIDAHFVASGFTPAPPGTTFSWIINGLGDWNGGASNWAPGFGAPPTTAEETAVFGNLPAITSPTTVVTNTAVMVNRIEFDNATHQYIVAGLGSVSLEVSSAPIDPSIVVTNGSHQFQAVVNLGGTTDVDVAAGGTLDFNNELNLHGNTLNKNGAGTMNINNRLSTGGGTINVNAGIVGGHGAITGSLNNTGGTISPGTSPGVLEISADYMQGDNAALLVEIGGTVAGLDHDQLIVEGTADLAGTLRVALLDGFLPAAGETFTVLEFGALSGSFDIVELPDLSAGLNWDTSALYSGGTLAVVPEPATAVFVVLALAIILGTRYKRRFMIVRADRATPKEGENRIMDKTLFAALVLGAACALILVSSSPLLAQLPTAGLTLHLDASDEMTIEDELGNHPSDAGFTGLVAAWRDKATGDGAHDATQATAVAAPSYLAGGGATGLGVVDFPLGAATFLDLSPVSFSAITGDGMTAFLVVRADYDVSGNGGGVIGNWETWLANSADGDEFITTRTSDGPDGYDVPVVAFGNDGETRQAASSPLDVQFWHLITAGFDANGSIAHINGEAGGFCVNLPEPMQPCTATSDMAFDTIGDYANAPNFIFADGEIAEIALYDTFLNDSDRQSIESFLGVKWGVPVESLPPSTTFTWNKNNIGDWNQASNWRSDGSGAPPDTAEDTAIFGSPATITSPTTVVTNSDVTVNRIEFDNATHQFGVAGAGSVNLEMSGTPIDPSIVVTAGSHQFQTVVNLGGTTDVDVAAGGTLDFNNELNLHGNTLNKNGAGTMSINNRLSTGGGTINVNAGIVGGHGVVTGSLNNSGGTISPGTSPGVLEISADYMQGDNAALLVEIGGTVAGLDHDQLIVEGTAHLAGTLQVALLDGFLPAAGDTFTVLEFGALHGTFGDIELPDLSAGRSWDTSALYSGGTLAVVPEPTTGVLVLLALAIIGTCIRR